MDITLNEAAFTPKHGKIKPADIFSDKRRDIDEKTVTNLGNALARDDSFFHPILVRDEGSGRYRLIAGLHRVEASKRRCGEDRPIPAIIYPPDTPDALLTVLEIEENLLRKDLTAAERERQTILLAAALKELDCEKSLTPAFDEGETETGNQVPRLASTAGGRGNKGVAQRVAEKVGITKRAVRKRLKAASAAIGEKIDLDHDTPEELKRKAAKRQHAAPKAERPKHGHRAPQEVVDDEEFDSGIEEMWKAYSALDGNAQVKIILRACRSHGWGLRMGPRWRVPAVDGEPAVALPAKAAPATDAAAADSQNEQQDDAIDLGTEDLQDADHASEDVDDASDDAAEASGDHASDHDVSGAADDHACDDADDVSEAAAEEPGGATMCAYCNIPFESGDQLEEFNGKLYHGFCVEDGKRLAKAKQGKQIAIAA